MNEKMSKRTSRFWALAVGVMAIMGFGLAGAFMVATTVASHVPAMQPATGVGAEKVPASLAAKLQGGLGTKKLSSSNWGGYGLNATAGTIIEAFGEWFVPSISCAKKTPSIADQWVGIDGLNDGTVEQGGTYEYCAGHNSGPYDWTWFEFYPYNDIQSVSALVSPGDLINAYILYNPYAATGGVFGIYTIVVEDLTTNTSSFSVQGNPSQCNTAGACESGPDQSAECISESLVGQGLYLPNYGTETFYTCDASVNGYWAGIGGLPHGAHATVWDITTYGYTSGKVQQSISKLSTYDYKDDQFTITWKRYN
jgi:hypothetical protein